MDLRHQSSPPLREVMFQYLLQTQAQLPTEGEERGEKGEGRGERGRKGGRMEKKSVGMSNVYTCMCLVTYALSHLQ